MSSLSGRRVYLAVSVRGDTTSTAWRAATCHRTHRHQMGGRDWYEQCPGDVEAAAPCLIEDRGAPNLARNAQTTRVLWSSPKVRDLLRDVCVDVCCTIGTVTTIWCLSLLCLMRWYV